MAASAPARSGRWLFGPVPDLLLGCGGLYALIFAASAIAGPLIRGQQAHFIFPLLVLLISYPHYGATLLRVYEQREERRGYALFAVHLTGVILALFIAALYLPFVAILMVTVFLTWSPWHYTGQNYGLALLFLRRRGIDIDDTTKRWIYTSFITSFLLTFVVMHEASGLSADNLLSIYRADAIRFWPLGIPAEWSRVAVIGLAAIYLLSLGAASRRLLRNTRAIELLPAAALAGTQALWFLVPFVLRHAQVTTGVEPLDWDFRLHYFVWIALGHAIQYLWITSYYARQSGKWPGLARYYGKVSVSGIALWTLPLLLFASTFAGGPSFEAGLGILVASAVNIHHFVLDGAIWKLRHNKIGRVLLRENSAEPTAEYSGPRAWLPRRSLVWSVAAAGAAVAVAGFWLEEFTFPGALHRGDWVGAERSVDTLKWLGRDSAEKRRHLGRQWVDAGDDSAALAQLEASATLRPHPQSFTTIGQLRSRRNEWSQALEAFESALSLAPDQPDILRLARVAAHRTGNTARAKELGARSSALGAEVQGSDGAPSPSRDRNSSRNAL